MPKNCSICGVVITDVTARINDGLCMLCKKGATCCSLCGRRSFSVTRGVDTGDLCLTCLGKEEMKKPSQIQDFITTHGNGDCELLKCLFLFAREYSQYGTTGHAGLILIDPPGKYPGTDLYNPRMTPKNSIAFAEIGGDDVHFSLLTDAAGGISDASPVVMTVPMASDDPKNANLILGATLHEFLCLGCMHGFFELEQLQYEYSETIQMLLIPPQNIEADDEAFLKKIRQEFGLSPWQAVGQRLDQLQKMYKPKLRFRKKWLSWF